MDAWLKDYFDDNLNRFNNSEIMTISFNSTTTTTGLFTLGPIKFLPTFTTEYFPYKVSDIEIGKALKNIISVPFILSVDRYKDNIRSIVVHRVFV
jgi:hypothetical protein